MPNRGKYSYRNPEIDESYKKNKLDKEFINQVNYLATRLKFQACELQDIAAVRNNPNTYPDRYYEMKFNKITNSSFDKDMEIINTTDPGEKLSLDQFNKLIDINNKTYATVDDLFGLSDINIEKLHKFTADEKLTYDKFAKVIENYNKINNYLNRNWSRYFDGSGYCIVSCQVACQAACQLGCQSCQYNTCHNQNCGGWS